jgi:hypothetical protein
MNTWRQTPEQFIKEVEAFGFEKVLEVPFHGDPEIKSDDKFYVFFHEKYGIILTFDTYNGRSVNSGNFYYEWIPNDIKETYLYTSTGGFDNVFDPKIWEGSHDCRENMISNILGLASGGKFVTPWVCKDHFTSPKFVHWGDHHTHFSEPWDTGYKMYQDACKNQGVERFNALPEHVKKAIEVGYREGK